MRSGTLLDGKVKSSERNIWAPACIWELLLLRKDLLEGPTIIMLLVQ